MLTLHINKTCLCRLGHSQPQIIKILHKKAVSNLNAKYENIVRIPYNFSDENIPIFFAVIIIYIHLFYFSENNMRILLSNILLT